jgi:hypothetical protein
MAGQSGLPSPTTISARLDTILAWNQKKSSGMRRWSGITSTFYLSWFFEECEHVTPLTHPRNQFSRLLDATRVSDGQHVFLKVIEKSVHPYEAEIGQFFSTEPVASDPQNHCVPIYEVLQDPDDEDLLILVMPLLRLYFDPMFDTVGEVVEFLRQVFRFPFPPSHCKCLFTIITGSPIHAQASRCPPVSRQFA